MQVASAFFVETSTVNNTHNNPLIIDINMLFFSSEASSEIFIKKPDKAKQIASKIIISRFYILSNAPATINGNNTVASPTTVTRFEPFFALAHDFASSRGAPLKLPPSPRSRVI